MLFSDLAKYFEKLEKTSSRLEITAILKELFERTSKDEIQEVVYLSLGMLAPNYEGVILNLAEKQMVKAISLAYGLDGQMISSLYKKMGDLGKVAEGVALKSKLQTTNPNLTTSHVFKKFLDIANDNGGGSQKRKITKMANILTELDPLSSRYVVRIPVGKLRLGFSEKTVLDALGVGDKEYNIYPDIGHVAYLAKINNLKNIKPKVGVPVVPMLAQRLNSPREMVKKMGKASVEPKFDGLRIFIHFRKSDNFLRIFTRNMNYLDENIFPELKEIGKYINTESVILDTEAVGLDIEREGFVDFQKTIQRRRKHEIDKSSKSTPLQFQVFDIILVGQESLIEKTYLERRKILEKVVENGSLLRVDEYTVTDSPEVIKELHLKYLKKGLEGIVAKKIDGKYVAGRTGWNWVKMKEEEGKKGKITDTIDAVIMGYTQGKGKRSGFGVGQFLAGVRDGEKIVSLTKVGTGITDEQFKILNKELANLRSKGRPKEYEVHKDLTPDYWVVPKIVVELTADEITASPKHTSGYALRFPRLVKFRPDKSVSSITTLKEIKEIV